MSNLNHQQGQYQPPPQNGLQYQPAHYPSNVYEDTQGEARPRYDLLYFVSLTFLPLLSAEPYEPSKS